MSGTYEHCAINKLTNDAISVVSTVLHTTRCNQCMSRFLIVSAYSNLFNIKFDLHMYILYTTTFGHMNITQIKFIKSFISKPYWQINWLFLQLTDPKQQLPNNILIFLNHLYSEYVKCQSKLLKRKYFPYSRNKILWSSRKQCSYSFDVLWSHLCLNNGKTSM
jgi:hypothetical protein